MRGIKNRSGFTLLELSLVLLLMSILFGIMFGVMQSISRVNMEMRPSIGAHQDSLFVMNLFRSTISQAYFHSELDRTVFVGRRDGQGTRRRDEMTLVSNHSGAEHTGVPAVREVTFYLRPQEDELFTLIRREKPTLDEDVGEGGAHYPLLTNVRSLRFSYSLNGEDWSDEWHSRRTGRIPRFVRVELIKMIEGREERFEIQSSPGLYLSH